MPHKPRLTRYRTRFTYPEVLPWTLTGFVCWEGAGRQEAWVNQLPLCNFEVQCKIRHSVCESPSPRCRYLAPYTTAAATLQTAVQTTRTQVSMKHGCVQPLMAQLCVNVEGEAAIAGACLCGTIRAACIASLHTGGLVELNVNYPSRCWSEGLYMLRHSMLVPL